MKASLAHKAALSDRSMEIPIAANFEATYIFPGRKATQPLSEKTFSKLMRTLEVPLYPADFGPHSGIVRDLRQREFPTKYLNSRWPTSTTTIRDPNTTDPSLSNTELK